MFFTERGVLMTLQRVLIADSSEEFRRELARCLSDDFAVQHCGDGKTALHLMDSFCPDVLVMDVMLPHLDGLGVLSEIAQAYPACTVLVTTRFISDYVLHSLESMGVRYVIMKPCSIRSTAQRVRDLAASCAVPMPLAPEPRSAVNNLLVNLGIPTRRRGYACLREAILLYARNPAQSVTKELYPAVAERCSGTSAQVERAIRSAIAAAWERRAGRYWQLLFPEEEARKVPRLTNALFISRIAEHLTAETGMENKPYTDSDSEDNL